MDQGAAFRRPRGSRFQAIEVFNSVTLQDGKLNGKSGPNEPNWEISIAAHQSTPFPLESWDESKGVLACVSLVMGRTSVSPIALFPGCFCAFLYSSRPYHRRQSP